MKSSRSAQKRCCPSPVCFGALHWCFAESGCHGDKSINPRGFPNDWQKHTFNPLQGYYTGMTRRGVIELLYFPLFCRTCWGGGVVTWFKLNHLIPFVWSLLSCHAVTVSSTQGLSELLYAQTAAVKMKATLSNPDWLGRFYTDLTCPVNKTHLACKKTAATLQNHIYM